MSRRHALQAVAASAAASALMVGGFALAQPSAATCAPLDLGCILGGGGSSSTATTTATTTTTTTATTTATATTTVTVTPTATATSTAGAKTKATENVTLSRLRIVRHGRSFAVSFTVTNTGTLSIGGYLITAHIPGYQTHAWLANLPVGQPVRVSYTWRIRAHHKLLKVVVRADPHRKLKESDESDNVLSASKRLH